MVEELEEGLAGHAVVERDVPRYVAGPSPDGQRFCLGIVPQYLCAAAARPDEVEEEADGCGLAGAVGSQEAEDIALLNCQPEAVQGQDWAVGLGEAEGQDRRGHSAVRPFSLNTS